MNGGHHAPSVIAAGERCEVQPSGDLDFEKHVYINGSGMTFRTAMLAGYVTWQPAAAASERSYAVWTAKAEAHDHPGPSPTRPVPHPRTAPGRATEPAFGLQREE